MNAVRAVLGVLVCVASLCCVSGVYGVSIPASVMDTYTPNAYNADFSLGWRFIPTEDFTVTHLGVFDVLGDGVQDVDSAGGQEVSLFPWGGGAALVATVVPTTATEEASGELNAHYVEITPITLTKDVEYFVAARVPAKDNCYSCTFVDEALRPFTRSWGHATFDPMPDEATDPGTFPIGPNGAPDEGEYHWYGPTFKYELIEPTHIPGDANNDTKVNDLDAAVLAENWYEIGGWEQGDFDDNGFVDAADAAIMTANWGYGTEEAGSPVPEPGILVVVLGALASLIIFRRGRQ